MCRKKEDRCQIKINIMSSFLFRILGGSCLKSIILNLVERRSRHKAIPNWKNEDKMTYFVLKEKKGWPSWWDLGMRHEPHTNEAGLEQSSRCVRYVLVRTYRLAFFGNAWRMHSVKGRHRTLSLVQANEARGCTSYEYVQNDELPPKFSRHRRGEWGEQAFAKPTCRRAGVIISCAIQSQLQF